MKLTVVDPKIDQYMADTPDGMAFWAGTGPVHTTCRECIFFTFNGYKVARGMSGGQLRHGPCKKYIAMTGISTKKLPPETKSCKYFEKNPAKPSMYNKGKD